MVPGAPAHVDYVADGIDRQQDLHGREADQVGHPVNHHPRLPRVDQRREDEGSNQQQDQVILLEGQRALVEIWVKVNVSRDQISEISPC